MNPGFDEALFDEAFLDEHPKNLSLTGASGGLPMAGERWSVEVPHPV